MNKHEERKQQLLEEGKKMGLSKSDMLALSTDPFFVGSPDEYESARWIADLWDRMMAKRKKALHLRGFHYWIQSQGIQLPNAYLMRKEKKAGIKPGKYAHDDPARSWDFLLSSAKVARYLGIGTWDKLVDLKHPDPSDYDSYWVGMGLSRTGVVDIQSELNGKLDGLVDEFIRELAARGPRYHEEGYQMYHMEVWCEKNSMGFVIDPACKRYGACYQPLVGQSSVEKVNLAAARAIRAARAGKRVRLFYIADWDRYGWGMVTAVARKLEFMTKDESLDLKLTRLALNDDHINAFNLPKAPKHGEAVVELDALEAIHPGELGKIVEEALKPYYDGARPSIVRDENYRIREVVKGMLEEKLRVPLQQAFEGIDLAGIAGELDLTQAINPEFKPPVPDHWVDDGDGNWVLDSARNYWVQLEEYRRYKDSRTEEEA